MLQSSVSAGASGASRNFARRATRYYALHSWVAGRQGFKQLEAIRSTVDCVQALGDHSELFCAWNSYTNSGGVCPIQACHSGVFHVLDLVGSSRVGVVCSVSQHAWVWLVRLKSSRLGVVSSRAAFSFRSTTFDFRVRQN